MNGWLLDTNVISELQRRFPDQQVLIFIANQNRESLFLSTVNLVEVRFGIHQAAGERRIELSRWLEEIIRPMFGARILPVSEEVLLLWRMLVHQGRKSGRTFPQPDLFLAATALEHDLTLVTRNVRDFAGTGVRTFNPWDYQP